MISENWKLHDSHLEGQFSNYHRAFFYFYKISFKLLFMKNFPLLFFFRSFLSLTSCMTCCLLAWIASFLCEMFGFAVQWCIPSFSWNVLSISASWRCGHLMFSQVEVWPSDDVFVGGGVVDYITGCALVLQVFFCSL